MSNTENLHIGKQRLFQIFNYLKALNEHRNPVKNQISEQPWVLWLDSLPEHDAIYFEKEMTQYTSKEYIQDNTEEGIILKIRRPEITSPPKPPDLIKEWLEKGWDNPEQEVKAKKSIKITEGDEIYEVKFEDDPERVKVFEEWSGKRKEWARTETPARKAKQIFERFYELYSWLEKESERYELVLGDGILNWSRTNESIYHPILLQRLQLEFNPDVPEFMVIESDYQVELYSALFQSMLDVDGKTIATCRDELIQNPLTPLDDNATEYFHRLVVRLSPGGEIFEDDAPKKDSDEPQIGRSPVIFVRSRNLGFATAIENVLENLQERTDLPDTLLNVVGIESSIDGENQTNDCSFAESEDILLGKLANDEQIEIGKRLENYSGVIVQGPPGTGKTHTIANILGHLLAKGNSVLVTSHTTKALRVLRQQVEEELKPLCVSVLESDSVSRKQLEDSVETIVEWLSHSDAHQLEKKVEELDSQRKKLISELQKSKQELHDVCYDEYRDIVIAGEGYAPSDAAKIVTSGEGIHDWIPSPVIMGEPLPLSANQVFELYRTNITIKPEDETEISEKLPDPESLLTPTDFKLLINEYEELSQCNLSEGNEFWEKEEKENLEEIKKIREEILNAIELISGDDWKIAAIAAGYNGSNHREPWDELIKMIENVREEAARCQGIIFQYQPQVDSEESFETLITIVDDIIEHLNSGKKLNKINLLIKKKWKHFIQNSFVGTIRPYKIEHFKALRDYLRLKILRYELANRWDSQLAPLGAPSTKEFNDSIEDTAFQFVSIIQECLDWYELTWEPLEEKLSSLGFQWKTFLDKQPPNLNSFGEIHRIKEAVQGPLQEILDTRMKKIRSKQIENELQNLSNILNTSNESEIINTLYVSVKNRDVQAYENAFERLVELYNRITDLKLRRDLLQKLDEAAPGWAAAIRRRQSPHDKGEVPGDIERAWMWRQLHDEIERRAQVSLPDLQYKIEKLNDEVKKITRELIKYKAWEAQLRRTTVSQRQALVGYLNIMSKIGKGTGKKAPKLRAEARRKTSECREAVPAWIMPLARVAENFDPRQARFDVAIIDEASQCDVMGFLAFYMAKKVVIVGDHEQVSPVAVGQKQEVVQHLIDEHLQGIPNKELYDGQRSVYDVGRESFGGTLCLIEHFRCVPEIIQFSNKLSYNGKIKPLRDSANVLLKPHVVSYRVESSGINNKTNYDEALVVASLLAAAIGQPEYEDKTFGVVSLLGDENNQAREIDRMLRHYISEDEYKRRRIISGNSAHFQGDEREVMFVSVVDVPSGNGPLSMRGAGNQDMWKKRYNVAASRACDQMWVVHSLDPRTDLKPGDLRRQLIEHAEDPYSTIKELESAEEDTESVFEKDVMQCLIAEGYSVIPQWKVGGFRIDLVVEGNSRKLAIECDGDRYHSLDKLKEDMERQAILERLGWTFVRIRGSQFYRNADHAMQPVWDKIKKLGITPKERDISAEREMLDAGQELKQRVVKRAAELRRHWLEEENEEIELEKYVFR